MREIGDNLHLVLDSQSLFLDRPAKEDTRCEEAVECCIEWNSILTAILMNRIHVWYILVGPGKM